MPSGPVTWLGSEPGHLQYGSLLMGPGLPWYLAASGGLNGWEDSPTVDSGTVMRAQQHGAFPGRLLAQSRIITAELVVLSAQGGMDAVVRQLAAATPIDSDTEQPLIIQVDDTPRLVWARCTRRSLPVSDTWRLGVGRAVLQFEATDPRRYEIAEQASSTGLPVSEPGLVWGSPEVGLVWGSPEVGLVWGTPGSTGDLTCTTGGETATYPVIEIQGPVTTPSVTLDGSGLILEYDLTLAATDTLVIDTWEGTVLLGGQSRIGYATWRSVPESSFVLPPGAVSTISFRSGDVVPDPAASATVRWRSALW